MHILGYGEDSLTLWALKSRTQQLLNLLDDHSDVGGCKALYRPSYGRKGTSSFGEFDAVLATSDAIYCFESKWDDCGAANRTSVQLEERQVLRHHIFSWYFQHWNPELPQDWEQFRTQEQAAFQTLFPQFKIPSARSLLARNLQSSLTTLHRHVSLHNAHTGRLRHVLLYFYQEGMSPQIQTVEQPALPQGDVAFQIVNMEYGQLPTCPLVEL